MYSSVQNEVLPEKLRSRTPKYLRLISSLTETEILSQSKAINSLRDELLTADKLLARSSKKVALDDWGDDGFQERLSILLQAVRHSPNLSLIGALGHRTNLTRALCNRLLLIEAIKTCPDIDKQTIESPILISGIARSGTTYLHRLLSSHPLAHAPRTFEVLFTRDPRRLNAVDERIAKTRNFLRILRLGSPETLKMHPMSLKQHEECYFWLEPTGLSWQYPMTGEMDGFQKWLEGQSLEMAYQHHAQQLRYLQWQKSGNFVSSDYFWCLKSPFHLFGLEEIIGQFPKIRIVIIHRNPIDTLASWLTLVGVVRHIHQHSVCYRTIGRDALSYWSIALGRMKNACQKHPENFIHVRYEDLLERPLSLIKRIYQTCGRAHPNLQSAVSKNISQRSSRNKKPYDIGWYGLQSSDIDQAFGSYIDHLRHIDYI